MEISSCSITANISITSKKDIGLTEVQDVLSRSLSFSFSNGVDANEINQIWHTLRNLALGTSEDLDLVGTLTDPFGDTVNFEKVKGIFIKHLSVVTKDCVLKIGGAVANDFSTIFGDATDKLLIQPGGGQLLISPTAAGYACAAGSDILKIENTGAADAADYEIVIIGTQA